MKTDFRTMIRDQYKDAELVRLINPKQVYFYLQSGVYPLWLEAGYNDRIVYVFEKEPTLKLFACWRKHEIDEGRLWESKC